MQAALSATTKIHHRDMFAPVFRSAHSLNELGPVFWELASPLSVRLLTNAWWAQPILVEAGRTPSKRFWSQARSPQ